MRKFVIATAAAVSLLGAASAAHAGWWDIYGYYHCNWIYWPYYGWVCS
ncbi:MAG TPA: hypothetical protein VKX28_16230 [Xanthobacteraceae bacterium]|nr:hypothetical protein [Xanthobacteraceae bacterium]